MSTGPSGGAPFPFINVAPLIISCEKGPSEELVACEMPRFVIKKKRIDKMNEDLMIIFFQDKQKNLLIQQEVFQKLKI